PLRTFAYSPFERSAIGVFGLTGLFRLPKRAIRFPDEQPIVGSRARSPFGRNRFGTRQSRSGQVSTNLRIQITAADRGYHGLAPAMGLGDAIGRIGVFLGGVDGVGKPTTLPWGVQPGHNCLVPPAPVYDAAFDVAWFLLLMALRDHPAMQNGNVLKFGLAGYAVVRFFIEFVRNNRVIFVGLTGQQLFFLVLLAGLGVWFVLHQKRLATA